MAGNPIYPFEDVRQYPTAQGIVADMRIEEFHGWRTQYFEFAIYLQDGRRFFTRRPDRGDVWATLGRVNIDSTVVIAHLGEQERGRGHRIVNFVEDGEVIYSFEETLEKQSHLDRYVRLMMLAGFALGCLFLLIALVTKPKVTA